MNSLVIITNNFPPIIDGVGDYSFHLYQKLKEASKTPVYVVCRKKKEIDNFIYENGLQSDIFPIIEDWDINNCKKVINHLKVLKCKKILIQYVPYSYSRKGIPYIIVYLFFLLKLNRIETGIFFHEVAVRLYRTSTIKSLLSINQLLIAQCLYWLSKYKMTSIRFNAKQLIGESILIPIPSNFERQGIVGKQFISTKLVIACFANRINDFYASLIKEILDQFDCDLVLLGKMSDPNPSLIELKQIRGRIKFTGSISNSEMIEWFQKTDIFLHLENVDRINRGGASLKNGSLSTAFAFGVPVISTKGDMTDLLLKESNLILYPDDTASLADWIRKLRYLVENNSVRKSMSISVKEFYQKRVCWEIHSIQVLGAIDE